MSKATNKMVVDQSGGLHHRVANRRTDERESALFQIFAHLVGFGGLGRDLLVFRPGIDDWLSANETPDVGVEATEFLLDLLKPRGIFDRRADLQSIANDSGIGKKRGDLVLVILRDQCRLEIVESEAISFPLLEDRIPAQSGLRPFEDQELEPETFVVNGHAPFLVVVANGKIVGCPVASLHPQLPRSENLVALTGRLAENGIDVTKSSGCSSLSVEAADDRVTEAGLVMQRVAPSSSKDPASMRPRLLALAYRMLGSVADAEDAVQDAYVRLQQAAEVVSPDAWLVKTTTRVCIDRLRLAKRRKEYVGSWLPEPTTERWDGATMNRPELAESLSMAFLVLLETLTPAERAVYLLRDVFDYEFEEIAMLLEKTPVNVRQIAARARKRLGEKERRFQVVSSEADDLADRFFDACRSGDLTAIESLLTPDAIYLSDGGGKAYAAPKPITGLRRISNLLAVVYRKRQKSCDVTMTTVNGQPGVVFSQAGKVIQITSFASENGRITRLFTVLNPDKLSHWHSEQPSDKS